MDKDRHRRALRHRELRRQSYQREPAGGRPPEILDARQDEDTRPSAAVARSDKKETQRGGRNEKRGETQRQVWRGGQRETKRATQRESKSQVQRETEIETERKTQSDEAEQVSRAEEISRSGGSKKGKGVSRHDDEPWHGRDKSGEPVEPLRRRLSRISAGGKPGKDASSRRRMMTPEPNSLPGAVHGGKKFGDGPIDGRSASPASGRSAVVSGRCKPISVADSRSTVSDTSSESGNSSFVNSRSAASISSGERRNTSFLKRQPSAEASAPSPPRPWEDIARPPIAQSSTRSLASSGATSGLSSYPPKNRKKYPLRSKSDKSNLGSRSEAATRQVSVSAIKQKLESHSLLSDAYLEKGELIEVPVKATEEGKVPVSDRIDGRGTLSASTRSAVVTGKSKPGSLSNGRSTAPTTYSQSANSSFLNSRLTVSISKGEGKNTSFLKRQPSAEVFASSPRRPWEEISMPPIAQSSTQNSASSEATSNLVSPSKNQMPSSSFSESKNTSFSHGETAVRSDGPRLSAGSGRREPGSSTEENTSISKRQPSAEISAPSPPRPLAEITGPPIAQPSNRRSASSGATSILASLPKNQIDSSSSSEGENTSFSDDQSSVGSDGSRLSIGSERHELGSPFGEDFTSRAKPAVQHLESYGSPADAYLEKDELVGALLKAMEEGEAPASNASAASTSLSTGDTSNNDFMEGPKAIEEDGRSDPGDAPTSKSIKNRISSGLKKFLRRRSAQGGAALSGTNTSSTSVSNTKIGGAIVSSNPAAARSSKTVTQSAQEADALSYWSRLSVKAAMAVMSSGKGAEWSEVAAQQAANMILEEGRERKQAGLKALAAGVSVAVLEAGGDGEAASAVSMAIINEFQDWKENRKQNRKSIDGSLPPRIQSTKSNMTTDESVTTGLNGGANVPKEVVVGPSNHSGIFDSLAALSTDLKSSTRDGPLESGEEGDEVAVQRRLLREREEEIEARRRALELVARMNQATERAIEEKMQRLGAEKMKAKLKVMEAKKLLAEAEHAAKARHREIKEKEEEIERRDRDLDERSRRIEREERELEGYRRARGEGVALATA